MPGIAEELFVHSDKLPIRLYCSICLDVAESAVITNCDHLFCKECINELQAINGKNCECPNCRKQILPMKPATNARNFLSQQLVFCSDIPTSRCGWTGKYSMWHTHTEKYCSRASKSDKLQAKNARSAEIGNLSKEELITMSVGRLKKILQEYIKLHYNKLSDDEINNDYNFKKYLEKSEYVNAILKFESIYGVTSIKTNSPSKSNKNKQEEEEKNDNEFPTTYDGLKKLKIRQLTQYLKSKNIDPTSNEYNCIEKKDLIKLVLKMQKHVNDVLNGNIYDPKFEKQNFSPPPPTPSQSNSFHYERKQELEQDDDVNNNNNTTSATSYAFTSDHLRRSSINRINVNDPQYLINDGNNNNNDNNNTESAQQRQQQHASSTTYAHVYNNQQHVTNINNPLNNNNNNNNQNNIYRTMPNNQRMFNNNNNDNNLNNNNNQTFININNHHNTQNIHTTTTTSTTSTTTTSTFDNNHNNNNQQPPSQYIHQQQQQQQQHRQNQFPFANFPFPQMPQMPNIPQMPFFNNNNNHNHNRNHNDNRNDRNNNNRNRNNGGFNFGSWPFPYM